MGSGCAANQQCLPGGAHGDCSNAATVTSVPYTHYGNTEGGEDNYDPPVTGICDEAAWASFEAAPDEVVRFLAPDSGVYRFKIGPSGTTFNAGLYAVTDCEEIDSSCLASAEGNASDLSDELLLSLASDESAYVIVDGVVTGQGVYQLEITECIASCDGKDCGDDGCGGVCGVCAEGTECSVEKLCVSS
jgi:hypothetical protein